MLSQPDCTEPLCVPWCVLGSECSRSVMRTACGGWARGQLPFPESCFFLGCHSASLGRGSQRICHPPPAIPPDLDMKIDSKVEKGNELFSSLNVLLSLRSHQGCNKHHTPKPQKKILHFRWVDFLGSPLDGLAMMYLLFIKVKCVPHTVPVALFWKLKSPADASPGFFSKLFILS